MDPIGTGASSRSIDMTGNLYFGVAVDLAVCSIVAEIVGSKLSCW